VTFRKVKDGYEFYSFWADLGSETIGPKTWRWDWWGSKEEGSGFVLSFNAWIVLIIFTFWVL
jgi:hypothetical protein